jgi:hypothetical protein
MPKGFAHCNFVSIMVRAQMLSELEEIIAYKQYADQPERQQTMRKTWMKRCVMRMFPDVLHLELWTDCKGASQKLMCGNASFK